MHPLAAARKAIEEALGNPPLTVEGTMVQFCYTGKTGEDYFEGIAEHYPAKEALKIGIMPDVEMVAWRSCELFFDSLARQIEPFLAVRYGRAGHLQLYDADKEGRITKIAYEVPVLYEALDDEEMFDSIGTALVRAIRAMALLCPVFERMSVTGITPSYAESFRTIEREHGLWEIKGFTTSEEDKYAHMPRGLYENLYTRDATRPH